MKAMLAFQNMEKEWHPHHGELEPQRRRNQVFGGPHTFFPELLNKCIATWCYWQEFLFSDDCKDHLLTVKSPIGFQYQLSYSSSHLLDLTSYYCPYPNSLPFPPAREGYGLTLNILSKHKQERKYSHTV